MKFKRVSKKLIHDNNFVLFENNWLCENKNNLIDLFQGKHLEQSKRDYESCYEQLQSEIRTEFKFQMRTMKQNQIKTKFKKKMNLCEQC